MKFEDSGHHLSDKFEARIRSVAISAQALVLFAAMTTSPALQARRALVKKLILTLAALYRAVLLVNRDSCDSAQRCA